jgi:hypothetical protein
LPHDCISHLLMTVYQIAGAEFKQTGSLNLPESQSSIIKNTQPITNQQ